MYLLYYLLPLILFIKAMDFGAEYQKLVEEFLRSQPDLSPGKKLLLGSRYGVFSVIGKVKKENPKLAKKMVKYRNLCWITASLAFGAAIFITGIIALFSANQ